MEYIPAAPTTTYTMLTWASDSSYWSWLCLMTTRTHTFKSMRRVSMRDMQYLSGVVLGRWMICWSGGRYVFILLILIIITHCWSARTMSKTFWLSLTFQMQVSQSRASSWNLSISALTSEAHSRWQPLQRLCVPCNGFMRVFSSSIELMQVVWARIYSFSIMVFCILNINGLNSYHLPYPYKYQSCVNET